MQLRDFSPFSDGAFLRFYLLLQTVEFADCKIDFCQKAFNFEANFHLS